MPHPIPGTVAKDQGPGGPRRKPRVMNPEEALNTMAKAKRNSTARTLPADLPYAGLLLEDQGDDDGTGRNRNAGRNAGDTAVSAPHLLVSGPTGSQKTRGCLAQNVVIWGDRPVVAMSSKGDLAEITIRQRAKRGPVYLLDLSGEVRDSELQGVDVTRIVSDPCALVDTDDEAMNMASLLLKVGKLTAGGDADSGDSFWETLATRPLANFIRAGGWVPDAQTKEPKWGGGVNWALAAAEDNGSEDDDKGDGPVDILTPNWNVAYTRSKTLLHSRHAPSLKAAKKLDPKQRDSIGINCMVALAPWTLESVAGDGSGTAFHPRMLEEPGATLYIVSPFEGGAAPAATAVITQCINHWRKRVGQLPELMMVLDELPNGAPLPTLAQIVGEARGLGVRMVVGVQASSQFEERWGTTGLKILRDIFPAVLVYTGVAERELLEVAASAEGEEERSTSSTDATGKSSLSKDRVQVKTWSELLPPRPGTGRLLLSGMSGVTVRLPDIAATSLRA